MNNNLFGELSGLMKGFSGFMPQDDPEVKLLTAQSELADFKTQETELYAQIGRQALAEGSGRFPDLETRLQLIQSNMVEADKRLKQAQREKEDREASARAEEEAHTCPSCGSINPTGVQFCQDCGTKLGILKCCRCGETLSPGIRFCGACGAKQGG